MNSFFFPLCLHIMKTERLLTNARSLSTCYISEGCCRTGSCHYEETYISTHTEPLVADSWAA